MNKENPISLQEIRQQALAGERLLEQLDNIRRFFQDKKDLSITELSQGGAVIA